MGVVNVRGVGCKKDSILTTKKPVFAETFEDVSSGTILLAHVKLTREVRSSVHGEVAADGYGLFKTKVGIEWHNMMVRVRASRNERGSSN